MPVQITDTNAQISFNATPQTWIVAPGVNAGGGVGSAVNSSTLVNYGNVMSATQAGALFLNGGVLVHNAERPVLEDMDSLPGCASRPTWRRCATPATSSATRRSAWSSS